MMRASLGWLLCAVMLIAFAASAQDSPPEATDDVAAMLQKAFAAHGEGDYSESARQFARAAAASTGIDAANNWYNAGCCHALGGQVDDAFEMLETAIDAGYANFNNLTSDMDLANLRDDPRWQPLVDSVYVPEIVITTNVATDPAEAAFVYDDVHNFVRAMELIDAGADPVATLESEYFAKASAGLDMFIEKYPFEATGLARAIERRPEKYSGVGDLLPLVREKEASFREAFAGLQAIAPQAVFPPTYFVVDIQRGIASGSPEGQLITLERRTPESIARMETLLVHETLHFQQLVHQGPDEFYAIFGPKKTLLALTIREGAGEFFADRVTGRMTQDDAREYVAANEADLWRQFHGRMHTPDTANWLWSTPDDPNVPRDIAYVFGALIVEAYYQQADDKAAAVEEILSVTDYEAFLKKSGYAQRFAD